MYDFSMSKKLALVSENYLYIMAYSAIAIAIRNSSMICAVVLSLLIAEGIVLSLIAIENAFLDLILALS